MIASPIPATRFKPFGGFKELASRDTASAFDFKGDSAVQRGRRVATNGGRWHVVAHMSQDDAGHAFFVARNWLVFGVRSC